LFNRVSGGEALSAPPAVLEHDADSMNRHHALLLSAHRFAGNRFPACGATL
jgi:hypothetical protein